MGEIKYANLPYQTEEIGIADLKLEKAISLVDAIRLANYCEIGVIGRMEDGHELITFDIQPEVSQSPIIDIQIVERITVLFLADDGTAPYVFALREDFPLTMHLNSMSFEKPRCLCLYETPYSELKLSWTSNGLLERIREWLRLTSRGELHQSDQPLEPFLLNTNGSIILPYDLRKDDVIGLLVEEDYNNRLNLRAIRIDPTQTEKYKSYVILQIEAPPQLHGYLIKTPDNLNSLDQFLSGLGLPFIEERLKPFLSELKIGSNSQYRESKLVIVLTVPKKRNADDVSEVIETITFVVPESMVEIGNACRLIAKAGNMVAPLIPKENFIPEDCEKIPVHTLRTYKTLNRARAAMFSGIEIKTPKIGLIGAGALGSQLLMNMCRMGYGEWTVLDSDIMLPHNLVRHELLSLHLGQHKSTAVANLVNFILDDEQCSAIKGDYLTPSDRELIIPKFSALDLILDASASLAVARKLAHDPDIQSRRISVFFNPAGTDLVILAEPEDRSITLDNLEMQYYGKIMSDMNFDNHLKLGGQPIRYSASCRDITSTIRQEDVAILSGIATKALRQIIATATGGIHLWQLDEMGGSVSTTIAPSHVRYFKSNSWTIACNEFTLNKLRGLRSSKLPSETGGVLIGSYDQESKTIYIVDTIPSPKDSKEYPTAYYRGIDGLALELDRISAVTANNLQYVGEWHSHPDGSSIEMSDYDNKLFDWISAHMEKHGLPPLMLILGESDKIGFYTSKKKD